MRAENRSLGVLGSIFSGSYVIGRERRVVVGFRWLFSVFF